jgi:hypothetical protein
MPNTVAVATQHGKLAQIAPAFEALSEWKLELALVDTDEFGTFSGEIERRLSPRETVIAKARAGAQLLGVDYGIASEGTIGAHPGLPFINSNQELLAFVCISTNVVVVESYLSTAIVAYSEEVTEDTDLPTLFKKLDLPDHAANIVAETDSERNVYKGIRDPDGARNIIQQLQAEPSVRISVESDFRAMNSPSRQANIEKCAQMLAQRLSTDCPACSYFGWGKVGYEYGVPCMSCGLNNARVANAEKLGCLTCDHVELHPLGLDSVEPARCEFCNP